MRRFLKKLCGLFLCTAIVLNTGLTIYAEDEPLSEKEQAEKAAAEAALAMPIASNSYANWPEGPSIYGESGIIMDINSGAVLYAKEIDTRQFPASITKIMTSLAALENSQLTDKVTFTEDSISFLEYGDAHIGMRPGEEISMEDALYAVLLASANEVSYAVAENAGGLGYDKFIEFMNTRAKELGAQNTNFVNANGLHDENHYTSARDMALMASELFRHPESHTIMQTLQHTILPTNLEAESRIFQQNHKMLYPRHAYYYEFCKGGKTGFTNEALTTLVTYADNGNMQLVAVNLKTHGANVYPDTRNMFDYAYNNFQKVPIKDLEKSKEIETFALEEPYVVLPEAVKFDALKSEIIETGAEKDRTGKIVYTYNEQPVGTMEVTLSDAYYEKKNGAELTDETKKTEAKKEAKKEGMPLWGKVLLGIVATGLLAFAIYFYFALKRYKRRMARKRRRQREQRARKSRNKYRS